MEIDWPQIFADIEDRLFVQLKLDAWERTVYMHLLRHTWLKGSSTALFAVAPLSKVLPVSDIKVREVIRSLHAKGCVSIEDRSRQGHSIQVFLPEEISHLARAAPRIETIDVESFNFFDDPRGVSSILYREGHKCFYCLRSLSKQICELDHLIPQVERIDHSYRNIVASCHQCNKSKGANGAASFIRGRYQAGLLSEEELQERLATLAAVQEGARVPNVQSAA